MKFGVIGDTHGNTRFLVNAINELYEFNVDFAVVLGDFGIFPAYLDTHEFLDEANAAAKAANMRIVAVRGNHDSTDYWRWHLENMPNKHRNAYIRSHIMITPDLNSWTFNGKRIFTVNGAVSIDRISRLYRERSNGGRGPRTQYWPDEAITENMVNSALRFNVVSAPIDYLFSHECSDKTPFQGRLEPDPESQENRFKMDKILNHLKPRMHFHGHMHTKYDWVNSVNVIEDGVLVDYHEIQTFGLDCDGAWDSWGVLDTQTDEFMWRGVSNG